MEKYLPGHMKQTNATTSSCTSGLAYHGKAIGPIFKDLYFLWLGRSTAAFAVARSGEKDGASVATGPFSASAILRFVMVACVCVAVAWWADAMFESGPQHLRLNASGAPVMQ